MKLARNHLTKMGIIEAFVFAIALISVVQGQGGTIQAPLTDDSYINNNSVRSNYGAEPTLRVSMDSNFTWLKFDLSSIPDGADEITALLELYTAYNGVNYPHDVIAYLITNNFNNTWDENTLTANNCPPITGWLALDSEYVANNETWYEWNVTEAVVGAIDNNSTAVTLILMYPFGAGAPEVLFNSKEGSLTKTPKLTVSWVTVIPEFQFLLISSIVFATIFTVIVISGMKHKARAWIEKKRLKFNPPPPHSHDAACGGLAPATTDAA